MTQNLREDKVTKIIEPNQYEFMLHSLPDPQYSTVVREASITFKFLDE